MKKIILFLGIFFILLSNYSFAYNRIVSINPSITQILFALGVGDKVVGVTYHDTVPFEATKKAIIGGFFAPSLERIEKLNPDLIFCSKFHREVRDYFKNKCKIIILEAKNFDDIWKNISFLGKLFGKENIAKQIIQKNKKDIELIQQKLKFIPKNKRKKVIRLMGAYYVPGPDSFQIEHVKKAGGLPFISKKKGSIVPITLKEWQDFNPDVIYFCGDDRKRIEFKNGWEKVNAVKNKKIFTFPCVLTCRPSIYTGYFVQWLSASIYGKEFFDDKNIIVKHKILKRKNLGNNFNYVSKIELVTGIINDFHHKTLLITFKNKQRILSTLDGFREVKYIGNHYLVPPRWNEGHRNFKKFKKDIAEALEIPFSNSSLLYTGANMDNLSFKKGKYKDIKIEVFTTAGVRSNAMRTSRDKGIYITHGTINIIVLTNLKLTDRAMTRTIITVTEAKTAALQDMDIRSSYQPIKYQATGTGTDNIIVVSGNDRVKDIAGGHSKFAEILSKLVYSAVQEAVKKQNRLVSNRNIFQRLEERDIRLYDLAKICNKYNHKTTKYNLQKLQNLLLTKEHSNFLKSCMAVSDDYEAGIIKDKNLLFGIDIEELKDFKETNYPYILDKCIDILLNKVCKNK